MTKLSIGETKIVQFGMDKWSIIGCNGIYKRVCLNEPINNF